MPREIVTVPGKVDACAILPQPSFGDPRGLDRLESIGDSRGLDLLELLDGDPQGLDRLELIGDPQRLDQLEAIDRGFRPEPLVLIDQGSARAWSTRIDRAGVPQDLIDSIDSK